MIRNDKMRILAEGIDSLDKSNKPITYYNLIKLKTTLSNTTILKILNFLVDFNIMRAKKQIRGEKYTIEYHKKLNWNAFRRHIEK